MILAVTNLKGGVGKSTVAQNLAVCFAHEGKTVCILDTDMKQTTTIRWATERAENLPKISVSTVDESKLTAQAEAFAKVYDVVILDGRPDLEKLATKTIAISDLTIIPIAPKGAEIWSLQKFVQWFDEVNEKIKKIGGTEKKACLLLNMYRGNRTMTKEIEEFLSRIGIPVLEPKMADRTAYMEALTLGFGVLEYPKDPKAKSEMKAVFAAIKALVE
jgi:chromosome partitioning protein